MIRKILLWTAIVLFCLFIPISCATCKGIVRAEEKTTVSLTSQQGTIDTYAEFYYLLGGLPVQNQNSAHMNVSTQSIILYNERLSSSGGADIYETKLIVPVRNSYTATTITDISLGTSGGDRGPIPTGIATAQIAFNNADADAIALGMGLHCDVRFYVIDSSSIEGITDFDHFMRSVVMVKRFNYVNQGNYYCAFQFITEYGAPASVQLYFKFPAVYSSAISVPIESYESYIFPQATLDIRKFIDSEVADVYTQGFNDGYSSREPFETIVNGVNEFMSLKIFGKFTFGTMFGIIISLSMLFLGLHLFRG